MIDIVAHLKECVKYADEYPSDVYAFKAAAEEITRLREENAQLREEKRRSQEIEWGLGEENVRLREETDEWEKSHNTLVEEIERLRTLVIQLEDYNKALSIELRKEITHLRAALIGLNTAIDDFWNDKTLPSIAHMNEQTVLTVAEAQRAADAAYKEVGDEKTGI